MKKESSRIKMQFKRISTWIKNYRNQLLLMILLVLGLSFMFPGGSSLKYKFQLNDIAPQEIIAPFDFHILVPDDRLQSDLEEAQISEPFLFNRNQQIVDNQIATIAEFFDFSAEIRAAKSQLQRSKDLMFRYRYTDRFEETRSMVTADSATATVLMSQYQLNYPFTADSEPWQKFLEPSEELGPQYDLAKFQVDIVQICRNRWAEGIYDILIGDIISNEVAVSNNDIPILSRPNDFNDLEMAWQKAKVDIYNFYPEEVDERRILADKLVVEFMKPNLVFDKETTERRQEDRKSRVPRFRGMVKEGERIVDEKDRITSEVLHKLNSLTTAIAEKERLERNIDILLAFLGRVMLVGVVVSFFFTFLITYRKAVFNEWKFVLLLALIFLIEHSLAFIIVINLDLSEYLIPIAVAAMVLTILFDARIGFMAAASIAMLSGIIMGNNLDFVIVSLFQSSAAVYSVRRLRTRGQIFTAIFVLSLASTTVVLAMGLFKAHAWSQISSDMLYLLGISILSPIINYGLIGLLEIAFDITTDLTLLELSDFNHPILKRMQKEANGTFNHSVVVGNLAESCANAIGVRSLLCRVGAYYHDIGKMQRSEYFIENQFQGENKHDTLTPVMSAKIVRNHVKDGLQLAEEYGLPQVVSNFIPMHHGTGRIEYFYHRALEEVEDPDSINESAYRYPGPKPNTKETGLIMICEAVEAAVRSMKRPDIFKVEEIIDRIIDKRVEDGQLDECPLTLDDLRRIKGEVNGTSGMLPVIRGIYHIRVEYPEDESSGT